MPTPYKDRLIAIRNMLDDQTKEVEQEGYDLLYQLWLENMDSPDFDQDLISIAVEHNNITKEFENRINGLRRKGSDTDIFLKKRLKKLEKYSPQKTTIDKINNASLASHDKRFDAVRIQLRSALPSDILRATEQIKKWLQEDSENQGIYALLLDAVQENPDLREGIYTIIEGMIERGSKAAVEALNALPTSIQNLIADADNAYYATEYDKAILLYQKVLRLEPANQQAQIQLAKAEANKIDRIRTKSKHLPREAVQFYRQARSYIAAKDLRSATIFLQAAIEEAHAKGTEFLEAEDLLNSMQSLFDTTQHRMNEKAPFKYDAFISYSHRDENWVQNRLLTYLEAQNIRVCIDFRDFEVGAPNITEMERAVIQSRKTVIVLTPDYLKSAWTEFENILVQSLDPTAHERTLLPILLKSCELPLRIRSLNYLDFTRSDGIKYQFDRLASAIK